MLLSGALAHLCFVVFNIDNEQVFGILSTPVAFSVQHLALELFFATSHLAMRTYTVIAAKFRPAILGWQRRADWIVGPYLRSRPRAAR